MESEKSRRAQVEANFADVFGELKFIEPFKQGTLEEQGLMFKHELVNARLHTDELGLLSRLHQAEAIDDVEFLARTLSDRHKFGAYTAEQFGKYRSLYMTTLNVLQSFLQSDMKSLILMEDDAYPRSKFLDTDLHIPEADILVWGGACNSLSKDNKSFALGKQYAFKKLQRRKYATFTTCYEFTRRGADILLSEYNSRHPMPTDIIWCYAFRKCEAYTMSPMGIIQKGESTVVDRQLQMLGGELDD